MERPRGGISIANHEYDYTQNWTKIVNNWSKLSYTDGYDADTVLLVLISGR